MLATQCALGCTGRPAATMAMSTRALLMAPQASIKLSSRISSASLVQPRSSTVLVHRKRTLTVVAAAEAAGSASEDPLERALSKVVGPAAASTTVTLGFIALWYGLNVAFNLQNKVIFNYFPYPWTVSTVHVVVGLIYCSFTYLLGAKAASFDRPITKKEFAQISGPASMHAIGHIAANVSFAAVAISLTHTVKTLEPAFNCLLSKLVLGVNTPLPVVATLVPIMAGVALASAAELSFNWLGFLSAMASNLTFGFRAVWSKKAMKDIKNLSSTGVYAYTTLISCLICVPLALAVEGPTLKAGVDAAIAKVGAKAFYTQLLLVGLLYHLYNQFAFNTLGRVSPVAHGVCNVVKRVAIIGTSVLFFGNTLTMKTKIGTVVALLGTYLYTEASRKFKDTKKA